MLIHPCAGVKCNVLQLKFDARLYCSQCARCYSSDEQACVMLIDSSTHVALFVVYGEVIESTSTATACSVVAAYKRRLTCC
jgi:hypothetical protein